MSDALSRTTPLATIVMYHIVHRRADGVIARLKGLDAAAFREQLGYIRRHYSPVDLLDLVTAPRPGDLPPRPIVLSFDDGYAAHYDIVYPILADARLPAVFFPVSASMLDRRVLDVNKIQCILAAADRVDRIVEAIDLAITRAKPALSSIEWYREQFWKASRWDPPEIVYCKRLLQFALPEHVRRTLVDELFTGTVTADEQTFADELYLTAAQAREMREAGLSVGAHGGRHLRLPTLSRDGQALEIDDALRVLDAAGMSRQRFAYSYANGESNQDSMELLRARGCAAAVTTRPDLARLGEDDLLRLPRVDTNDLPVRADAELNEWTRRAAGQIGS